jgi:hypothetical protein
MKRFVLGVPLLALLAFSSAAGTATTARDWPTFNYTNARLGVSPDATITAANISSLKRRQIHVDGTVDSTPIYVHGRVRGHDAFIVTTTYGKTEAIDANTGRVLWRFTPPGYSKVAGSAQITNSSPTLSTDRKAVYAAASDGEIRKLRLSDGKVLWETSITRDPTHEKITSSLNVSRGLVVATTGGYIGDAPPYQGHVVTMFEGNGHIDHVWNSLCSDRHELITPSTCSSSDSAIWSRSGAAVDPANGDLVVATGNAPWNGSTDWGDSVIVLSPDAAAMLRHWTPADQAALNSSDLDLGSTSPAFLQNGYAVQGGKDAKIRLLQLHSLPGVNDKTGGELQTVPTPGRQLMFTAPAVWKGTWAFVTTSGGTAAYVLRGGRLHLAWSNDIAATSPVVVGGLLYAPGVGGITVWRPTTGKRVAFLPIGPLHWQSAIVADGRIAIGQGDANDHATSGILNVYSR